ncbi:MAG: MmcQ/YjbR family DNA-binding protein [Thalassotalea sp.]
MDYQQVHQYLVDKPETQLLHPFGEEVNVYKVKNKMFATLAIGKMAKGDGEEPLEYWLNLKCDPDEAIMLRDIFPAIIPGYHMNKRHWNTVILNGSVPQGEIERMIDNSFKLVVEVMPKRDQQSLLLQM